MTMEFTLNRDKSMERLFGQKNEKEAQKAAIETAVERLSVSMTARLGHSKDTETTSLAAYASAVQTDFSDAHQVHMSIKPRNEKEYVTITPTKDIPKEGFDPKKASVTEKVSLYTLAAARYSTVAHDTHLPQQIRENAVKMQLFNEKQAMKALGYDTVNKFQIATSAATVLSYLVFAAKSCGMGTGPITPVDGGTNTYVVTETPIPTETAANLRGELENASADVLADFTAKTGLQPDFGVTVNLDGYDEADPSYVMDQAGILWAQKPDASWKSLIYIFKTNERAGKNTWSDPDNFFEVLTAELDGDHKMQVQLIPSIYGDQAPQGYITLDISLSSGTAKDAMIAYKGPKPEATKTQVPTQTPETPTQTPEATEIPTKSFELTDGTIYEMKSFENPADALSYANENAGKWITGGESNSVRVSEDIKFISGPEAQALGKYLSKIDGKLALLLGVPIGAPQTGDKFFILGAYTLNKDGKVVLVFVNKKGEYEALYINISGSEYTNFVSTFPFVTPTP